MSSLQARALKMKKLAKAEKKARALAKGGKSANPEVVTTTSDETPDGQEEELSATHGGQDVEDLEQSESGTEDSPNDVTSVAPVAPKSSASATFDSLGLISPLLEALKQVGYSKPTEIQAGIIPHALEGKDVIGVAETGSGKTAAFALPILQKLWDEPRGLFACVLAPTRELAYQIAQQFEALGSAIGVRCATIVGGMDMMSQSIALGKRPHIIVATPGRLNDHLENTKGFSLRGLRYLVLDEADRLLDMDFGPVIDKILKVLPRERNTFLFSATMSTKVAKLQRASLQNPVRVEVNGKYSTVSTLLQYYLLTPFANKDVHLVHLANELAANSIIIFTRTVHDAQSGLDIPTVDVVINFDIPTHSKDYIHRVGRTARAGRAGKSITLVTQYDVELLQRIEGVIGKKMMEFPIDKAEVMLLKERVGEAQRLAVQELKESGGAAGARGGRKRHRDKDESGRDRMDRDDDVVEAGIPVKNKKHRR
ncbi:ribosomal RNA processing protein [Rhizoctonia solani]